MRFEVNICFFKSKLKIIMDVLFFTTDRFYYYFVRSFLIIIQIWTNLPLCCISCDPRKVTVCISRTKYVCLTRQLFDLETKTVTPQILFKSSCSSCCLLVLVNLQLSYTLASHIWWDKTHSGIIWTIWASCYNYHFVESLRPRGKASGLE